MVFVNVRLGVLVGVFVGVFVGVLVEVLVDVEAGPGVGEAGRLAPHKTVHI
jgi:hypothetical protein